MKFQMCLFRDTNSGTIHRYDFLINVSFAVLGKAVPKMNVFMTSFAIRILSGLVLLVSSILLITSYIRGQ